MNVASPAYQPHLETAATGCVLLLPNGRPMIDGSRLVET
jgi:hypothetical protein